MIDASGSLGDGTDGGTIDDGDGGSGGDGGDGTGGIAIFSGDGGLGGCCLQPAGKNEVRASMQAMRFTFLIERKIFLR